MSNIGKRYLTLVLVIALLGSGQSRADRTAAAVCAAQFSLISRFLPDDANAGDTKRQHVRNDLALLREAIEADQRAAVAQTNAGSQPAEHPAFEKTPDGLIWSYRSGGQFHDDKNTRPEHALALKQRLDRVLRLIDLKETGVTISRAEEAKDIKELLDNPKFKSSERAEKLRKIACAVIGSLVGGGLGLSTLKFPDSTLRREIVAEAKATTVYTREDHLARSKARLKELFWPSEEQTKAANQRIDVLIQGHRRQLERIEAREGKLLYGLSSNEYARAFRYGSEPDTLEYLAESAKNSGPDSRAESSQTDPGALREAHLETVRKTFQQRYLKERQSSEADAELKVQATLSQHIALLDRREKTGDTPQYGSRFKEYNRLEGDYGVLDTLEKLATSDPAKINESLLDRHYEHYTFRDADRAFTQDELRRYEREKSSSANYLTFIPATLGGAGLGAFLGCMGSGRPGRAVLSRLRPQPANPHFKDFSQVVDSLLDGSSKSGGREWVWLGSNTSTGNHTDLIMYVDRSVGTPTIKFIGLEYKTPIDYRVTPKVEPPPPVVKTITEDPTTVLAGLQERLIAEHFSSTFGAKLAPIEDIFRSANRANLNPEELYQFADSLKRVRTMEDLKVLERLLYDWREAKNPEEP